MINLSAVSDHGALSYTEPLVIVVRSTVKDLVFGVCSGDYYVSYSLQLVLIYRSF